jgi:hypothetical protein
MRDGAEGRDRPAAGSAFEAVQDAPVAGRAVDRPALADAAVAQIVGADGAVAAAAETGIHVGDADERGLGGCAWILHGCIT